jgi:hypothetical protein
MPYKRIQIPLTEAESKALQAMCEEDHREWRDQMTWLLVQEARRRGLMPLPRQLSPRTLDFQPLVMEAINAD